MKKKTFTATALTLLATATPAMGANITPETSDASNTCITSPYATGCATWADEFNGNTLNESNWTIRSGYGTSGDYGRFTAENVKVGGGYLTLSTHKNADGVSGTSAEIVTKGKVQYENFYEEARIRDTGQGWNGVWNTVVTGQTGAGALPGEIDQYETFGFTDPATGNPASKHDRGGVFQSLVHFSTEARAAFPGKTNSGAVNTEKNIGEWVTIGMRKDSEGVRVYKNGVEVFFFPSSDPRYALTFPDGVSLHTLLSAHVGNKWNGIQEATDGGMDFDYVRVWDLDSVAPEPSETPAPSESPVVPAPSVEPPEPPVAPSVEPSESPSAIVSPEPSESVEPSESATPVESPSPTLSPSESAPVESPTVEPSESAEPSAPASVEPSPEATSDATQAPSETATETTQPTVEPTESETSTVVSESEQPSVSPEATEATSKPAEQSEAVNTHTDKNEGDTGEQADSLAHTGAGVKALIIVGVLALIAGLALVITRKK